MTRTTNMPLWVRRPTSSTQGIRKTIASRSREVIFLLSTGETYLECWIQFWDSQHKRDMELLERVQQKATEVIRDWSMSPMRKG